MKHPILAQIFTCLFILLDEGVFCRFSICSVRIMFKFDEPSMLHGDNFSHRCITISIMQLCDAMAKVKSKILLLSNKKGGTKLGSSRRGNLFKVCTGFVFLFLFSLRCLNNLFRLCGLVLGHCTTHFGIAQYTWTLRNTP